MKDKAVVDYFTNEMILAKVNGKEDSLLAQRFHIVAYPTLVMVDSTGEEVDRIIGYMPPVDFLKEVKNYREGIGTLSDLLKQAEANPERELMFEIAEKYHYRGSNDEAVHWYQKVIEAGDPLDSLSGECRMSLGSMFYLDKQYDSAIEMFTQIMEDFKEKPLAEDAEIWRAVVYRKKSDTTAAIAAFEAFVEHYPKSDALDYAQHWIAKLKGDTLDKGKSSE